MGTIKKKKPVPHLVMVDTSILWHKDKSYVVDPKFDDFWDRYAKDFLLELLVPEVVRGEILFQQSTSAIKSMKKATECIEDVCRITEKAYSHRITESRIKTGVAKRFDTWLNSKGGIVASTPVDIINWKALIDQAIWRKPPFVYDPKRTDVEKGFRDALIFETVAYVGWKEQQRRIRRIFLSKDELLRKAAKDKLKFLEAYESIDDFESYLKLTKEELEDQFISSILRRASVRFFSKDGPRCLYYRENVGEKLRERFADNFKIPSESGETLFTAQGLVPRTEEIWNPLDKGTFWISNSQFINLIADIEYHWMNRITFVRQFRYRPNITASSLVEALPTRIVYSDRILVLVFNVTWKAKVTRDGKFRNLSLLDMKFEDTSFEPPTEEQRKTWNLQE